MKILLERMNKQLANRILETNDVILKWRNLVHPSIQGHDFSRPPSSWVTLVRPTSSQHEANSEEAVMEAIRNTGWGAPLGKLKPGGMGSRMIGGRFLSKANISKSIVGIVGSQRVGASSISLSMGSGQNGLLSTTRAVEFPMHASRMASGIRLAIATERQAQQNHHHNTNGGLLTIMGSEKVTPENDEGQARMVVQTPGGGFRTSRPGSMGPDLPRIMVEVEEGTFNPKAWSDTGTVVEGGGGKRVGFMVG
ncbi:hypothetical protein HDU67_000383 [Dinochytrium kinnereticum]|nr:hypothetical protein HDU67_000383 [Dinochytrium kinnereticum]